MTPSAVVSGNSPFRIEWLFLLIWLIGGAGILRFHRAVPTTRWQLVVWRESPEVGELGAWAHAAQRAAEPAARST